MSYLILARKYRPQGFADLTGQETTARILQSAIRQSRTAPAYLFAGPRGTGKTTTARIFAKALNCQKRAANGDEPCNNCDSCQEISKGSSIDVFEMDAASHTQVDNIREVVISTVAYAPVRDKYKIFIIDEVHMLSTHSFNALLKTLEEPPAHVVFILATTEFHKIPATISSRCQRYRFLPLSQKQILLNLQRIAGIEKIKISEDALSLLARSAAGSMRDALSLLDQAISHLPYKTDSKESESIDLKKLEDLLGVVGEEFLVRFIERIAAKDAKGVLESIGRLLREGHDLSYFLRELRESFREMLVQKCGYGDEDLNLPRRQKLPVERFSLEQILRGTQILTKCAEQMRWNDFPRMVFECYAVRLCQDSIPAGEIVERLEGLESGRPTERTAPRLTSPERQPGGLDVHSQSPVKELEHELSQLKSPKTDPELSARPMANTPAVESRPEPRETATSVLAPPKTSVSVQEAPQAERIPSQTIPQPTDSLELPGDIKTAWESILFDTQSSRPTLYHALEMAIPSWSNGKIELTFPKPFWLDTVKRNLTIVQDLLAANLARNVILHLKLREASLPSVSQPSSAPSGTIEGKGKITEDEGDEEESTESFVSSDEDAVVIEELSEVRESYDQNEVFEPLGSTPSALEDAVEDEGMKKLLSHFHGKITRHNTATQ